MSTTSKGKVFQLISKVNLEHVRAAGTLNTDNKILTSLFQDFFFPLYSTWSQHGK